jgi:hypothetical protein
MKKISLLLFIILFPTSLHAASLVERVSGYILLQVEQAGEAWYVSPSTQERYYLGRPADAFSIMRELGLGISNADLASLFGSLPDTSKADTFSSSNKTLANRLSGQILLQVEGKGEAYYIYPGDKKGYYLGRPDDAFAVMRELGLGITDADLSLIEISDDSLSTGTVSATQEKYSLFSTLLAFNPNDGFDGKIESALENGWLAFTQDEDAFQNYLDSLDRHFAQTVQLAAATGYAIDREIPGAFVWNVIQPEEDGDYQWDLTDRVVTAVGDAGMRISGVIQPFAAWDQDSIPDGCAAVDFAYYDYKADTPTDWNAYEAFLTALVERYDGDGVNDMPGLSTAINEWEIGNEYDGTCGGDLNEPENYLELLEHTSPTIKSADADAVILNAGALELNSNVRDIAAYWESFFEQGGGDYIDTFNFHYNLEKQGARNTAEEFVEHLEFFESLLEKYNLEMPMWITEFGTFSGTALVDGGRRRVTQSEDFQAAWYFRYGVLAAAHGVETIFLDMQGMDNSSIGGSAIYDQDGNERAFAQGLRLLAQSLEEADFVDEVAENQFLFIDGDTILYALLDGELPQDVEGTVRVLTHLGDESEMDARSVTSTSSSPVLVFIP